MPSLTTRLLVPIFIALTAASAGTSTAAPDFKSWLDDFRKQAAAQGISQTTLDAALTDLQPIGKLLEYDRKQPEFVDTFLDYLNKRVNDIRLRNGIAATQQNAVLLADVERRYGIPAKYLASFWGLETNYGAYMGGTPVVAAMATLAYDARRTDFFRGQLLDALRIIDKGQLGNADLTGSWAGAMGHMQFIPSTYLAYAVDGDGDGRVDVRNSLPDAMHSAANYLRQAGWHPGEEWGLEVAVPAGFDLTSAGLDREKPLSTWGLLGLRRPDGSPLPDGYRPASLLLPQGLSGPAFLVTRNFRVILDWNRSVNYAIAVGHLADRLAGSPPLSAGQTADNRRLSREQMENLQKMLTSLGYDTGPADGVPGARTRGAIRAFQASVGLPADGYASVPLMERVNDAVLKTLLPAPNGTQQVTAAGKI